jgi:hypothetical protein
MRFMANLRFRLWMFWWRADKGPFVLGAVAAAVAGGLAFAFLQVSTYKDERSSATSPASHSTCTTKRAASRSPASTQ